jgi:hypothetical protein
MQEFINEFKSEWCAQWNKLMLGLDKLRPRVSPTMRLWLKQALLVMFLIFVIQITVPLMLAVLGTVLGMLPYAAIALVVLLWWTRDNGKWMQRK